MTCPICMIADHRVTDPKEILMLGIATADVVATLRDRGLSLRIGEVFCDAHRPEMGAANKRVMRVVCLEQVAENQRPTQAPEGCS